MECPTAHFKRQRVFSHKDMETRSTTGRRIFRLCTKIVINSSNGTLPPPLEHLFQISESATHPGISRGLLIFYERQRHLLSPTGRRNRYRYYAYRQLDNAHIKSPCVFLCVNKILNNLLNQCGLNGSLLSHSLTMRLLISGCKYRKSV